jgi:hypothetical protein
MIDYIYITNFRSILNQGFCLLYKFEIEFYGTNDGNRKFVEAVGGGLVFLIRQKLEYYQNFKMKLTSGMNQGH